jgi:hypothetical protein
MMRASDGWQLAQVNVARARFPLDSAEMADFIALLDPINALALRSFVYLSRHLEVMRRRREWFERTLQAYFALWWIPAGQPPTIADAKARLEVLREHGPSPAAFTFHDRYPAPESPDGPNQGRFEYGRIAR